MNLPNVQISSFKIQGVQQQRQKVKKNQKNPLRSICSNPAPETLKPNVGVQTLHGGLRPHLMPVM